MSRVRKTGDLRSVTSRCKLGGRGARRRECEPCSAFGRSDDDQAFARFRRRRSASPARPLPSSAMVAGSGTGGCEPPPSSPPPSPPPPGPPPPPPPPPDRKSTRLNSSHLGISY